MPNILRIGSISMVFPQKIEGSVPAVNRKRLRLRYVYSRPLILHSFRIFRLYHLPEMHTQNPPATSQMLKITFAPLPMKQLNKEKMND
jgi:hypothetical protein